MYDPHYTDPVKASNSLGVEFFKSRKEASEVIANRRKCSSHTADKGIKESISSGKPYSGFVWKYNNK